MRKINLFELFVKIGVKDEASKNVESISSKLGKGLKTAAKVGTAAVGAAASGIVALTKSAIDNFAEYEQLVGGAELMFGDAFDFVQQKSAEAYKNVQMSQNEYLQQVNGFATGLKTALGGNEQAAAELADRIITAEADIVAATGNTAENVQNAFNGIMKSNFTMLDNLQLGITPTKEGFQEVIDKVNEWNTVNGEATAYQMGNLADMQSALVDYVEMQGLAGYATNEASQTISGSLASAKSAWSNLITGIADDNANFEVLIDNFVESSGTVIENILPRIEKSLDGAADLVDKIFPIIVQKIPEIVTKNLPKITKSAINIIETLVDGLLDNVDDLIPSVIEIIKTIVEKLTKLLPQITQSALDLIITLAEGLIQYLPELTDSVTDIILKIVDVLTKPDNLSRLISTALTLILELANGIIRALPQLAGKVPEIITSIVTTLIKSLPQIVSVGAQIVSGVWRGIQNAKATFVANVKSFFSGIVDSVKNVLGIHSPSRVFAEIGGYMAEGLGVGWDDEFGNVQRDITNSLDFGAGYVALAGSGVGLGCAGNYGSRDINITQNIYSQAKSAAQLMQEARWQAKMGVLAGV